MTTKSNCNCGIKRFTNISLVTLFGKLQGHEMELMRLNQHDENEKKKKGIVLKASSSIHEESDKEDLNERNNLEEDDDFSLFVQRFNKFLRNKGNQRGSNFNPKKKGEDFSSVPKSYECDQPRHLRLDCSIFKRRMKKFDKKTFKDKKGKKAYITW